MTCRLKIRLDVLADNYGKFVRALGGQTRRVAGVLKADGYGMGAVEVARRLSREGCRIFFSANVAEAMTLREAQIQEIISYVVTLIMILVMIVLIMGHIIQ